MKYTDRSANSRSERRASQVNRSRYRRHHAKATLFFWLRFIVAVFILWSVFLHSPTEAKVYIDITSPYMRKIPIAVPYLRPTPVTFEDSLLGRNISKILSADLTFQGFFAVLNPSKYGGRQDADWQNLPVDYVAKGSLKRRGDLLSVELRLIDLSTNTMRIGRRYTGRVKDHRKMAHRFCDLIVQSLTGEHGVSLSRIAFVGQKGKKKEIYSVDFDGLGIRQETFDKSITVSPRYSPDGKYLAYTSYRSGRPYLYIKDLTSGKIYRLTGFPGLNITPAWHPNSKVIAVTLSKNGNPDLYLIDLKGRVKARLTRGPGINVSPSWSPDGNHLAFVSDRSGSPQIYIMDVKSRRIRRLTFEGTYNTDPQWSPKGDCIIYTGRTEGRFQIFAIAPSGGSGVQLTFFGNNENPSWSPDGRQIVFSSTRSSRSKALFVMFANGRNQRLLLHYGTGAAMPFWGPNRFN